MLTRNQLRVQFREALEKVDEKPQQVLKRRLFDGKKLAEVGREMNLTASRIYQLEQIAWAQVQAVTSISKVTYRSLAKNGILTKDKVYGATYQPKHDVEPLTLKNFFSKVRHTLSRA